MRSSKKNSADLLPYHQLRTHGTAASRSASMRRLSLRIRYVLLLSIAIIICVFFANLIIVRLDRSNDTLKYFNKGGLPSDEMAHLEPDDAVLERIRHGSHKPVKLPEKIIHLDLKGAPLNVNYLEQIMPLLRKMGATGLLIEYEDMFPYEGALANISATNCYSKDEIKRILEAAKANSLSVIPLIQTFGHLEFVLKLDEFSPLREVRHNPQALCPSRDGSVQVVREMLKQVVELHRNYITHLHIGSDEVFALGECNVCQKRMIDRNWQKRDLFISHATTVINDVHDMGLQAILWDDMFRNVNEEALKNSPLVKLVEIMVWNYSKHVNLVGVFGKYVAAGFKGLWIASAFKGAIAPSNQLPEYRLHLLNTHSWMQLVKMYEDKVQVKGIAITGWQRFDHFAALCEMFPVGFPVLALCMAFLETGKVDDQTLEEIKKSLQCNRALRMEETRGLATAGFIPPLYCDYPGSRVLIDVQQWDELKQRQNQLLSTNYAIGWMTPMNKEKHFSSPEHVIQGTRDLPELISMAARLREAVLSDFIEVTDKATAREWIATFLEPVQSSLVKLQTEVDDLLSKKNWPRRPLYEEL